MADLEDNKPLEYPKYPELTPEENLRNLNLILEELSQLNSSNKTDEELLLFLEKRDIPKYIPYPLKIIRLGKIEIFETKEYNKTKKIEVIYDGQRGWKNIFDFLYKIDVKGKIECRSQIINPKYFSFQTSHKFFSGNIKLETIKDLENKNFLLFRHFTGLNKFNKEIKVWNLVSLGEDKSLYGPIIREYMMRAYKDGIRCLLNPFYSFIFNLPVNIDKKIIEEILKPFRRNFTDNIYSKEIHKFLKKEEGNRYQCTFLE